MHITRVIPLFLRVLYLASTWEFSWVEGQRTWTVKVWPRLQHHLHVVPGLFEKTKKTKQHWKNKRNHFPGVLGTEGASQESQNIVFFFVSPFFLVFSSFFFLVFSLGPSSKSHFFPRFYWVDFSMFFWFYLRGLLQRVIVFFLFCCAFPVFQIFFWFSFSPFFLFFFF